MKRENITRSDLQAYQDIRELLFAHKVVCGQKIIFRDLEQQLGMSKTPISNALVRLEQAGLVISKPNRGYYVRSWSETEIRQIWELRGKLEEIIASYAASRHRKEELADLKRALDDMLSSQDGFYDRRRWELDKRFHGQIARMAGNSFMNSTLIGIHEILGVAIDVAVFTPYLQRSNMAHKEVFRAIAARDADKAHEIATRHNDEAFGAWLRSLTG